VEICGTDTPVDPLAAVGTVGRSVPRTEKLCKTNGSARYADERSTAAYQRMVATNLLHRFWSDTARG